MKKIIIIALALIAIATIALSPKETSVTTREQPKGTNTDSVIDDRAERLDHFFKERNMPLAGYGKKFVEEADSNSIDWRLLPAISVKESTGGKHMCKNNPFGWGSCKILFNSIDEAIETVARHLGGNEPRTHNYYKGDTRAKLWAYNGTVEPLYPQRVIDIMEKF